LPIEGDQAFLAYVLPIEGEETSQWHSLQAYPVEVELEMIATKVKELIILKFTSGIANAYRILQGM